VVWFIFVVVFGPEVGGLGFVFEFVVVVHALTRRGFGEVVNQVRAGTIEKNFASAHID
jgi:hypothetical protein